MLYFLQKCKSNIITNVSRFKVDNPHTITFSFLQIDKNY